MYFPVRLRDLESQVAREAEFFCLLGNLLGRFSCFWNMYQLVDRRFPGDLCHLVYCVELDDSSSLIRITHNRVKHHLDSSGSFIQWLH